MGPHQAGWDVLTADNVFAGQDKQVAGVAPARSGPLAGVKVIELAGIGPVPFTGMLLADLGADVVRVDRAGVVRGTETVPFQLADDLMSRTRRSIGVDLKHPDGVEAVLRLVESADALVEGFRPGVVERLGVGPDACLARNPRLVYGRMTGWGQDGPLAGAAGHDINYIALAGVLDRIGRAGQPPTPPLNLIGDFGGGAMLLAYGMACALLHAWRTGEGQVVDAAMVEGASLLMIPFFGGRDGGYNTARGTNLLDSGAPFYETYETADGKWIAIGAMEPKFYATLLELLGLAGEDLPAQMDRQGWATVKARFSAVFRTRTRAEWSALLEGTDACFAPVLGLEEVEQHPQHRARGTFVDVEGRLQPAPAPRFGQTKPSSPLPPPGPGQDTDQVLAEIGLTSADIAKLRSVGAIA
ncbi:MAG TPA: CaiB/BaiF CoA-transferase family protein [Acidimicrobiales bacterium]|nr:CaiB/BaiF CoA-transferase family protein [Acidimicrobiales bacterium]